VAIIDIMGPSVGAFPVRALLDRIRQLTHEGMIKFAINLGEVKYIDSYGLGGLAATYNWIEKVGGKIKFFAVHEHLFQILQRLHLDQVLDIYENEASALASF